MLNLLRKIKWLMVTELTKYRQSRVLRRIHARKTGTKIRVLFYVSDTAKWKCQSLYDLLKNSADFDPIVVVFKDQQNYEVQHCKNLKDVVNPLMSFFEKNGCNVKAGITTSTFSYIYPRNFNPDIIFIQQPPWGVVPYLLPQSISLYALPMYVPYFTQVRVLPNLHCLNFHALLHSYFVMPNSIYETLKREFGTRSHLCRIVPVGHPSLDYLYLKRNHIHNKSKVIYAPHFSFKHPNNPCILNLGTFEWNGLKILEYAKQHPEFNWVFKPHPVFRNKVISSGYMDENEIDAYIEEWRKIGEVMDEGNYQELFMESRAMITDCDSFLAEFGSTEAPIIHLISEDVQNSNVSMPTFVNTYYKVRNADEMDAVFKMVLERNEDPMLEARIEAIKKAGLADTYAAQNIVNYLRELLNC